MSEAGTIAIELVRSPSAEERSLVTELEEILSAESPPEQRHGLNRYQSLRHPTLQLLPEAATSCSTP